MRCQDAWKRWYQEGECHAKYGLFAIYQRQGLVGVWRMGDGGGVQLLEGGHVESCLATVAVRSEGWIVTM